MNRLERSTEWLNALTFSTGPVPRKTHTQRVVDPARATRYISQNFAVATPLAYVPLPHSYRYITLFYIHIGTCISYYWRATIDA